METTRIMAFFQGAGPAGPRMARFDLGFVTGMTLLEHG